MVLKKQEDLNCEIHLSNGVEDDEKFNLQIQSFGCNLTVENNINCINIILDGEGNNNSFGCTRAEFMQFHEYFKTEKSYKSYYDASESAYYMRGKSYPTKPPLDQTSVMKTEKIEDESGQNNDDAIKQLFTIDNDTDTISSEGTIENNNNKFKRSTITYRVTKAKKRNLSERMSENVETSKIEPKPKRQKIAPKPKRPKISDNLSTLFTVVLQINI